MGIYEDLLKLRDRLNDPNDALNRPRPVEHVANPRALRGEWTMCSCGQPVRCVDGVWQHRSDAAR